MPGLFVAAIGVAPPAAVLPATGLEIKGEGWLRLDGDDTQFVQPYALEDERKEPALGGGICLLGRRRCLPRSGAEYKSS